MVNLGLFPGSKTSNSVILSFKIPYYTHWGQHLLVCGSEPVLGSWNVKKGLLLRPSHLGDELIWSGSLPIPAGFNCEYSYYVVDDEKNVLRWEAGKKRKLLLPNGVQNGQLVELHDLWQVLNLSVFSLQYMHMRVCGYLSLWLLASSLFVNIFLVLVLLEFLNWQVIMFVKYFNLHISRC